MNYYLSVYLFLMSVRLSGSLSVSPSHAHTHRLHNQHTFPLYFSYPACLCNQWHRGDLTQTVILSTVVAEETFKVHSPDLSGVHGGS